MRVGVVSDTHNNLRNVARIVDLFHAAAVDRVIHTGDITQAKTLVALSRLDVPLYGVFGNNDERHALAEVAAEAGILLAEPPLRIEWAGRRIVVVHDPVDLPAPEAREDIALHGHTHRRRVEHFEGRLVFNPGECAGHLSGYNAVGVLDLATLDVAFLTF